MEAPESRVRVRPLPPEGETEPDRRAPSLRALMPLLAGGVILVAFIVVVGLGAGSEEGGGEVGAGATTTTARPGFVATPETTTTIPVPTTIVTRQVPELRELLPAFTGGLSAVVMRDDGSVAIARWRPDRRFPQFTDLPAGPGTTTFDAAGALVATLGSGERSDNSGLLSVGPIAQGTRPVFVWANSFAWHAAEPGVLALTGRQPTDDVEGVFVMRFDPTGALLSTERIADAGPTWTVRAFRQPGIAVVDSDIGRPVLRVITTEGSTGNTAAGVVAFTTDSLLIGAGETTLGFAPRAWTWELDDPETLPRYFADPSAGVPDIVSPNGRHGATIIDAQTSTIVVRSEDSAGPRSASIQAPITEAFFVTDDYIAAYSAPLDLLFIVNWRTGATVPLDLEGGSLRDVIAPGAIGAAEVDLAEPPIDVAE